MEKKQTKNKVDEIEKVMIEVTKGRTNKLIKPVKVPSWSKGMQLRAYKKINRSLDGEQQRYARSCKISRYNRISKNEQRHRRSSTVYRRACGRKIRYNRKTNSERTNRVIKHKIR